jgi:hypothetical protein
LEISDRTAGATSIASSICARESLRDSKSSFTPSMIESRTLMTYARQCLDLHRDLVDSRNLAALVFFHSAKKVSIAMKERKPQVQLLQWWQLISERLSSFAC